MRGSRSVFVTGATGLVGSRVLLRLLRSHPGLRATVLVRGARQWEVVAPSLDGAAGRVDVLQGDLTLPGLGLDADARARLRRSASAVVHAGANTSFSQSLAEARAVNTEGTRNLLELMSDGGWARRFTFVSTSFVAGESTGFIPEGERPAPSRWVNAYEQSKYEAELLVRRSGAPWVILRPSTVVCDSPRGGITQFNAVHRALRLYYHGLAPMMPGSEATPVDVVTTDYVARAVARLALWDDVAGQTLHLCAGAGALGLGELLDMTYATWAASPNWRRRSVARPSLTDLETYRLFEQSIHETGDERLKQVLRSLSHFVPQLAFPKRFDTVRADALLGERAEPVRSFWPAMVEHLRDGSWGGAQRRAA